MDSTSLKDSNGILFIIFGLINRKIWILQYQYKICDLDFEFEFIWRVWLGADPGRDAWRVARYDLSVPLRADRHCGPLDLD
jgi:hypothetical protein